MKKKLTNKLIINKETIADLSEEQLNRMRGGITGSPNTNKDDSCIGVNCPVFTANCI
jgi:hypothetical protein